MPDHPRAHTHTHITHTHKISSTILHLVVFYLSCFSSLLLTACSIKGSDGSNLFCEIFRRAVYSPVRAGYSNLHLNLTNTPTLDIHTAVSTMARQQPTWIRPVLLGALLEDTSALDPRIKTAISRCQMSHSAPMKRKGQLS